MKKYKGAAIFIYFILFLTERVYALGVLQYDDLVQYDGDLKPWNYVQATPWEILPIKSLIP